MARMTQAEKVMNYIRENGEISQRDGYKIGVYRVAAVIWDMKHIDGILIKTDYRLVRNVDGSTSRVAFYSLLNNDTKQIRMDI